MKKLVLHLGAHKTGSTFIQNTMKENSSLLNSCGVKYFGGEDARINFTRNIVYPVVGLRESSFSENELEAQCRLLLSEKLEKYNSMFLSNENVLGFCDLIKSSGYIYPKSDQILRFLSKLTDSWDVKLVFLIRNYAEFIESTYVQKIKEGFTYDFEDYQSECSLIKVSWVPIVKRMREIFGGNNVHVIKYEDFKQQQGDYLAEVMEILGCNGSFLNFDLEKNVNPSYSKVAIELARKANEVLKGDDLRDYRGFLTRRFPVKKYGRPNLFNDKQKAMYSSKYEDDCAELGV
ncbi:MAG: hypothetical protein EOM12_07480 [Verrucomicrobiae bacterium]|nr:hypothetical protein [Verrucomicrobiae bacterium]